MIKNTSILMLLLLFIPTAHANVCSRIVYNNYYYPNGIDSVVGTVQGSSKNTIEIYDESDKRTKRFTYLSDRGEFKSGERIRLYYYVGDGVVQNIKKETPVQYQKNGQNTGYVFKS